jgi:hypothetical protein
MVGRIGIVLGLMALACGDDPGAPGRSEEVNGLAPGNAGDGETDTVAAAASGELISIRDGELKQGEPPTASPVEVVPRIVSVTGPGAVTNGGSAVLRVEITPPAPSTTFIVRLMDAPGYHIVSGVDPELDGFVELPVQIAGETEQASLALGVAVVDASGNVGPYQRIELPVVHSGTGDVKVTLSFDRLHDLDLHVVEPNGDEIFYDRPDSATGGRLDLDSGAGCEPSAASSENVFWPPGGAPAGEYRVSVHNYQQCSPGEISFRVRVDYDGIIETYQRSFPDGTAGEVMTSDNRLEIVTFTRGL